jgi:DNA-binding transcriptional LysR family regulator
MWSDLTVRHLLAFRAVAEEGTFGRAADRLGFTQSAVSQQVAALESMVGVPLFDRPGGPRPPRLTEGGELMLGLVTDLIERLEAMERDVSRFNRGVSGRLVVATLQSVLARLLPQALRRLHAEAPDVDVTVLGEDPQRLPDRVVADGDADLAICSGTVDPRLNNRALGADPFVAVVPASEPPGPVRLLELGGRPMIGQPLGDTCSLPMQRELDRLDVSPNYVFRSQDNSAIQGMVSAGVGIAIVPLLTVDTSDPSISVRATVPKLEPRRLAIVWPKDRTLAPVAERFMDIVAEVCLERLVAVPTSAASQPAEVG